MRSLAAILYLLILGFLIVAGYLIEKVGTRYYKEEISEEYLHYSNLITTAIEQNLSSKNDSANSDSAKPDSANPGNTNSKDNFAELERILNYWRSNVGEELVSLKLVDKPSELPKEEKGTVSSLSVTDKTDKVTVLVPLSKWTTTDKALQFDYMSEYSDDYMAFYYMSMVAVYTLLAIIVTLIAWMIYRYIDQISQVTRSVAGGAFDQKMSSSKIPALKKLAEDINSMANTIQEKTSENLILTGAIHHELRIPITRMRLALDIALKQYESEPSNEMLSELLLGMDQDLEELSALTEEILTISRMRLSSVETKDDMVQVSSVLNQLLDTIDDGRVKLIECDEFTLHVNRTLFERALVNVITNAIKYADQKIEVKGTLEHSRFVLSISDDGPGIPVDKRDAVLKPFYRTDKSRNRNTGGFGLGLAIAEMVVKDCGGQIRIGESRLGGARVDICWQISFS